jgi:hypothetical protein
MNLPFVNNSLLISLLLSCFVENKYLHVNVETYKIGELPWHYTLGFFCWGRHRNKKRVVYGLDNIHAKKVHGKMVVFSGKSFSLRTQTCFKISQKNQPFFLK